MGIPYKIRTRQRQTKSICGKSLQNKPKESAIFMIRSSAIERLENWIPNTNQLPKWVWDLDSIQFEAFLTAYIKGDGSFYNHTNDSFIVYGKKSILEQIQSIAVTRGLSATLRETKRGTFRLNINNKTSEQFDCYKRLKKEPYNGLVWCLSVPNTNFLVRRNGKCHFTGNSWTKAWMLWGDRPAVWLQQGGEATRRSYQNYIGGVPRSHKEFFKNAKPYHFEGSKLFVHAGINPDVELGSHQGRYLRWNRDLFNEALELVYNDEDGDLTPYEEVYIGHTSLAGKYGLENVPTQGGDVWMMDTGAGWHGKLSVMDIETKEYWQSDPAPSLYPDVEHGRKALRGL